MLSACNGTSTTCAHTYLKTGYGQTEQTEDKDIRFSLGTGNKRLVRGEDRNTGLLQEDKPGDSISQE